MRAITWKRVGLAATVVVVGGTLAATGRAAARADGATPEPLGAQQPHGCLANQNHAALLTQAQSLTYGTTGGSEDTQVLWWYRIQDNPNSGIVPGPKGTVWPEDNAHTRTLDANGIIVAKVEIEVGKGRGGYQKLGLPEGISYVKVCRQMTGGIYLLHGLIIPESGSLKKVPRAEFNNNRGRSPVAKALWEWDPRDDHLCMSCGIWWCELW